jgi:hypothetical protein
MRAAGRSPGGPGEWNKVQKGQKSTWASCCLSTSPQKPPVPNLCHWQYNACHIGSYFIHSTPCRIVLHPSILSSYLSHVKQHIFLRPITCLPEIEHPVRIHCTLPASAHVKSPSVYNTPQSYSMNVFFFSSSFCLLFLKLVSKSLSVMGQPHNSN